MGIKTMVVVNVVSCKYNNIPSSEISNTALHIAEAIHPHVYLTWAYRYASSAIGGDGGEDIGRGVELPHFVLARTAEVGLDEFLHHVGLLEVGVVAVELGYLVGLEPVAEALAVEGIGLGIEPFVGDGMGVGRVNIGDIEGRYVLPS